MAIAWLVLIIVVAVVVALGISSYVQQEHLRQQARHKEAEERKNERRAADERHTLDEQYRRRRLAEAYERAAREVAADKNKKDAPQRRAQKRSRPVRKLFCPYCEQVFEPDQEDEFVAHLLQHQKTDGWVRPSAR